jgi:hypothetical protein
VDHARVRVPHPCGLCKGGDFRLWIIVPLFKRRNESKRHTLKN